MFCEWAYLLREQPLHFSFKSSIPVPLPSMGFSWKPPPIINSILESRVLVEGVFGTARNRRFLSWHIPTSSIQNHVRSPSKGLVHCLAYCPQPLGLKQRVVHHRIQPTPVFAPTLTFTASTIMSLALLSTVLCTATLLHPGTMYSQPARSAAETLHSWGILRLVSQ